MKHHNRSQLRLGTRRPWAVCLGLLAVIVFPHMVLAETRSIQEFLERKPDWERLKETVWTLEGRYAFIGEQEMKFLNCDLPFLLSADTTVRRGNSRVVEVAGRLTQQGSQLVFQVQSVSPRVSDNERVRRMRFSIETSEPDEWYRVADWAKNRSQFYDDQELLEEARDLDRNGVLTEFRQIDPTDEAKLTALVTKARQKQVDPALVERILHESLRARIAKIAAAPFSDARYRDVLVQMSQELKGSTEPQSDISQKLKESYAESPQQTYAQADEATRKQLHRLLYADVMTRRIEHDAVADGSNGFVIADRLREEVPEAAQLIARHEKQAIDYFTKKLDVMSSAQLQELTDRLTRIGREDDARQAKRDWLIAREPLYRNDGARGLVDLAKQWQQLLGDDAAAATFYQEAASVNPQYSPATEWLAAHGYQLHDGKWVVAADIPMMPVSPTEKAIREGRVEEGMTAQQVQQALGVRPSSITRIASSSQVMEWWVYEDAGVVVQFARGRRDADSSVQSVEKLSAPSAEK